MYGGPHNHLGYVFILDKTSYLNILASRGRKIGTFSHCCEIWEAHRQHCCGGASQILERSNSSEYKISRLRDFARSYNKTSYRILKPGPGGCFTNVSRALQNNLGKIYNARNNIYAENFKLKRCTCVQSMALGTRTKFQLEIIIRMRF